MNANFCKHLRNKKMYTPGPETDLHRPEEAFSNASHCWCNRTMTEVGPDDRPVGNESCSRARSCHET